MSFIPRLQHQYSGVRSLPKSAGTREATRAAPIGSIFNNNSDLFTVFEVASSTYTNETRVQ
ncbi:MAG: hypothetical protein ACYTXI_39370 [Nostoc sp.]